MQEVGGGFKATYNVGRKNGPGILPLSPFAKPPRPPVPYIFYEAFISQAWCAGEVITHTFKTVSDFLRVRMAQQLDLSSESIPLPHYSSLFFFLLCAQSWDHSSSHTYNSNVWSDGEPDGNGVFFFFFFWVHRIPMMTTARSRQGKVFYEIFPPTSDCTLHT